MRSDPREPPGAITCPHSGQCAGCPLIDLPYPEQLDRKTSAVRTAISRHASLVGLEVEPAVGAREVSEYRVRAKLVVAPGPALGLYSGPGHQVVDAPRCRVLSPSLTRVVDALRRLLAEPPPESGEILRPHSSSGGALSAVDLRDALGPQGSRVLVTLIAESARAGDQAAQRAAASALLAAAPEVAGVSVSLRAAGPRLLGAPPRTVGGAGELVDRVGAVEHLATPGAFVQAHRGQAAELHARLTQRLGSALGGLRGKHVLDLYGGSGAIGLALADAGARVTLVEAFAPAAEAAARLAGGRLEVIPADAASLRGSRERPDAVVVNPPRRGLSPEARRVVASLAPRAVAYVSCQAETLARDLAQFVELGYRTTSVLPIDMIPLSDRIEVLCILAAAPPPPLEPLLVRGDLMAVDKPAGLPISPAPGHDASLLDRVRALSGWERAMPLQSSDPGTSGVCFFARHQEAASAGRAAVQAASHRHLALVRGVIREKGSVSRPLGERGSARPARTRYRRLEVIAGHALVAAFPDQPRPQQVRRHLSGIGHPVLGDARFGHGPSNRHFAERVGLERTFLHVDRVELSNLKGSPFAVESPLPGDLSGVLSLMRA